MFFKSLVFFALYFVSINLIQCQDVDADWWKHAVFYQIYPRSFKDSDNDGNGDLQGIIEKLPVLKETGIDAIWISPIMQSPQVDQGYDISDYRTIDPMYGNMDDFMELLSKGHDLGLKIILDFVPNHTSDQHEWFKASVNGTEEYKDYYIWVDGVPGTPPNNWISDFRNSSWEWNDERKQYYLHQFNKAQPDLNYRNPKVRQAMMDVMGYWLDMGVDGFRIDAVHFLVEDEQLRDEPKSNATDDETSPRYLIHIYTQNMPETYQIVYEWREYIDNYTAAHGGSQRIMMTEVYATLNQTLYYYGTPDGSTLGAHFTFNFFFITDLNIDSTAEGIANVANNWLSHLPDIYVSNSVLGNHDQHRVATRLGPENVDGFNMIMTLMPGVGISYDGEEIGMENGNMTYEQGKDPKARDPAIFYQESRDFERTPYQWDNTTNAGFNEGADPWLPVSVKYLDTNLYYQNISDGLSHYKVYQKLMELRKLPAATNGSTEISTVSNDVLTLVRSDRDGNKIALLFKIGHTDAESVSLEYSCSQAQVELTSVDSSYSIGQNISLSQIDLKPHESLVLLLQECT